MTGEISRGDPRLAFDGQEYETLGLSVDLRTAAGATARRPRGIGITLDTFSGRALTYELMLTSDRAEELADGDAEAPNPLDPRSLEEGETIVMGSEHYSGNGQEVSYRVLQASLGFEEGRRLSSGVRTDRGGPGPDLRGRRGLRAPRAGAPARDRRPRRGGRDLEGVQLGRPAHGGAEPRTGAVAGTPTSGS